MGVHYSEAENRNAGVHKPRAPVVVEREFRRVAPNICESSVRNLFNATLLALRILAPFRDVLFQTALSEENHKTKISLSLSLPVSHVPLLHCCTTEIPNVSFIAQVTCIYFDILTKSSCELQNNIMLLHLRAVISWLPACRINTVLSTQ